MLLLYDLLWSAIWFCFFLKKKCKDSETGAYKFHKYTTKEDFYLILLDTNSVLSRGNGDKRLLCSVNCHYCHQQCQNSLEKLMGPFNLWHTTLELIKKINQKSAWGYVIQDKAEDKKQRGLVSRKKQGDKERGDTASFMQTTKPAFHVWNLAIINNTYNSIQFSAAECWGLKFRDESHRSHHHHSEESDIPTSSVKLMGEVR